MQLLIGTICLMTIHIVYGADLAIGLNADNSSNGTLKVSTVMMAFSYALPLDYNNTYLAAGLQGAYTFSQVALTVQSFP